MILDLEMPVVVITNGCTEKVISINLNTKTVITENGEYFFKDITLANLV